LKRAFEEVGNLTRVQPILVNDNFEIIDGQHRFIACKELDLPIYYTMVEGLGIGEARSMNILHRNWDMDDFARSYAQTGDPNYRTYLQLKEDYGFNHSILLTAILGSNKGDFKKFRMGEFVMPDEPLARKRLDYFTEVSQLMPFNMDRELARAINICMTREGFDPSQLLKKLALHIDQLHKQSSTPDYLRMLEDVYNFKVHDENRVRLF
jgi:hypothetical protein